MTLEPGDLETLAEAVYRLADWPDDESARPHQLAIRLFGPHAVRAVPNLIEHASISALGDRTIIAVRKSLPKEYSRHAIAHELAHWICDREGVTCNSGDELEVVCDYVGAAIHMRRGPFRRRIRDVGHEPRQLALDFGATATSAALRIGETDGVPLAVVTPSSVRARGPDSWQWPDAGTIRAWTRRDVPGVRKVALEDRRRIALVADVLPSVGG